MAFMMVVLSSFISLDAAQGFRFWIRNVKVVRIKTHCFCLDWQQSLVLHCSRLIRHPNILLGCRDMIYSSINNQVYQLKHLATAEHDGDRGLRPLRRAFSADPRGHK
jgi:hypothetical protein